MHLVEGRFSREEWNAIVAPLCGLSMLQTWEYAGAKAATGPWQPVRAIIRDSDRVIAAVQGTVRTIPIAGGGLLWINRGPLLAEGMAYETILPVISRWARERNWYARIAPPVAEIDAAAVESAGFAVTTTGGWCSSVVDLAPPPDDLRKRLDQKWRNCLNKAVRAGVVVDIRDGDAAIDAYADDLAARLAARPFETTVTPEFLRGLQRLLPADRKMLVLSATMDGRALGTNVMFVAGPVAEYMSGVLLDEGRTVNAGHALLWTAMTTLRERGVRTFDLGGMHPQRTPKGIFHFKEGVGGKFYCLVNELESTRRDWRSAVVRLRIGWTKGVS